MAARLPSACATSSARRVSCSATLGTYVYTYLVTCGGEGASAVVSACSRERVRFMTAEATGSSVISKPKEPDSLSWHVFQEADWNQDAHLGWRFTAAELKKRLEAADTSERPRKRHTAET